jgi:hypothetical protein
MSTTTNTALPKDLAGYANNPPIYWLSATADVMSKDDDHLNPSWRGMVRVKDPSEPCLQMALKYLGDSSIKISIELACGLAAIALKLSVPRPALVVCERGDLPELPHSAKGDRVLVFGSQLVPEDTFMATFRKNDVAAAEYVWNKVCEDQVGKQGAAWDELIANPDRHHMNLIFDGKWWLFDHDKAIPTAAQTAKLATTNSKNEFPDFILKLNQLASQMLKRHPTNHAIDSQVKEFEKYRTRLIALDYCVSAWAIENVDSRLKGIFEDTAYIINLIASRLPALALHISNRIDNQKDGGSLWTSHNQN